MNANLNYSDVGTVQPGVELGLVHEPDHGRGLEVLEDLQGHGPGQDDVPGLVHVAHGPMPQERTEDITPFLAPLGVKPSGLEVGFGQDGDHPWVEGQWGREVYKFTIRKNNLIKVMIGLFT